MQPIAHPSGPVFGAELSIVRLTEFGENVQNQILYVFSGGTWRFSAVFAVMNGEHAAFRPLAEQILASVRFPPTAIPEAGAVSEPPHHRSGGLGFALVVFSLLLLGFYRTRRRG
jgi:hypothetical protein